MADWRSAAAVSSGTVGDGVVVLVVSVVMRSLPPQAATDSAMGTIAITSGQFFRVIEQPLAHEAVSGIVRLRTPERLVSWSSSL